MMMMERIIINTEDSGFGHLHFSIKKILRFRKRVYMTMVPKKAPKIPRVA